MKLFARPYWIVLTVTIPQCLILLYYSGVYGIISSLLEPENIAYWVRYGTVLGGLIIAASVYGGFLQFRKRTIPWYYGLLALPLYVIFLVTYFRNLDSLVPFSIPQWMIPINEIVFLPVGLVMPVLLHSLLLLVDRFTPTEGKRSLVVTSIGTIVVPAFWYLMVRVIVPMLQGKISWEFYGHIQMVLFVVLTIVFMFLVLRLTYLLSLRGLWAKPRNILLVKGLFTIVLPLLSLLFYNGVISDIFGQYGRNFDFLGDWSHPAYYVLALVNGIVLTLPAAQQESVRFGIFVTKAFMYSFVTYFFIVLLPLFPVAVDVVIVFGLGFLLLSPLILFFFHTKSLYEDWNFLRARFGSKMPAIAFIGAFAAVPAAVTVSYTMDRMALNSMLTHVYEPDYASNSVVDMDVESARRVLNNIKSAKNSQQFFAADRKPYLTTYYQWLVLDSLTLSDKRLRDLERIFFGEIEIAARTDRATQAEADSPKLADVKVTTQLSSDGKYYKSKIDLAVTNGDMGNAEYVTKFRLPLGAWISDYHLMIDGKKVPGILSEKKSALWIYQQTRNVRRDPGIIYYTSPNEIILRVFPFSEGETRHTGFEVIHREPVNFSIDDVQINLQADPLRPPKAQGKTGNDNFVLLSSADKAVLPKVTRKPYPHFIIDRSLNAAPRLDDYINRINDFVVGSPGHGMDREDAMITFANYDSRTVSLDQGWEAEARGFVTGGGFFLQRAFKKALYRNYLDHADRYPVFIVVTDNIDGAIFTKGMKDFAITRPEGDIFFVLSNKHGLKARRFSAPTEDLAVLNQFPPASQQVLAWPDSNNPTAFLPDNGQASLVIKDPEKDFAAPKLKSGSWESGVTLYGMWLSSMLNPQNSVNKHFSIITNSFRTGLLSPLTAFLSPENDAQRQMLLKKQQRMLSSMRPLDIGEENQMDEPPLWLLCLFVAMLLVFGQYRKVSQIKTY